MHSKLVYINKYKSLTELKQTFKHAGAYLILTGRDTSTLKQVQNDLIARTNNSNITIEHLDLQSLSSVAAFAEHINTAGQPIYALVNNAGIFYASPVLTEDNLEATFQTNYVAPFLLTLLLLPSLRRSSPDSARIVNLSSKAHLAVADLPNPQFYKLFEDTPANRFTAYQLSKFYLVLFAYRLNGILKQSGVSVHCVDPGNVETAIYRSFPPLADPWLFALQKPIRLFCIKTPVEGSQGVLHALLHRETPPFYLDHLDESWAVHYRIVDPSLSEALWRTTRMMCQTYLTKTVTTDI